MVAAEAGTPPTLFLPLSIPIKSSRYALVWAAQQSRGPEAEPLPTSGSPLSTHAIRYPGRRQERKLRHPACLIFFTAMQQPQFAILPLIVNSSANKADRPDCRLRMELLPRRYQPPLCRARRVAAPESISRLHSGVGV